jgi:hypothetical protein
MAAEHYFSRQVHPNFLRNNRPTSQAFFPTPKDNGNLPGCDGQQITPAESYNHYVATYGLKSIGVWGASKFEISITGVTMVLTPLADSPAHAVIEFPANNAVEDQDDWRKIARRPRDYAQPRKCLYSPRETD